VRNYMFGVGSIVEVNTENREKTVMIIGQCPTANNLTYDYAGVMYPEGLVNDNIVLFNHRDIVNVVKDGEIECT
jgi:hypothetical protein